MGLALLLLLLLCFFGHTKACGILVLQPGIKPMPPVLEAWSLNHWTTREVPVFSLSFQDCKKECSCFPSGFAHLGADQRC